MGGGRIGGKRERRKREKEKGGERECGEEGEGRRGDLLQGLRGIDAPAPGKGLTRGTPFSLR